MQNHWFADTYRKKKNPTKAWLRTFLFVRNGIMSLKTVKPMLKLWQGLLSRK